MSNQTTILVSIRYPLTEQSSRTLAAAGQLAHDQAPADLRVLHVNLIQNNEDIQTTELTDAISSVIEGVNASVTTRQGFLVEEVILQEAIQIGVDIIVVGANQKATWRRLLSRAIGNDPAVSSFLRDNITDSMEIIEIDTSATSPSIKETV